MKANNVITKSESLPTPLAVRDKSSRVVTTTPQHLSLGGLSVPEDQLLEKAAKVATALSKVIEDQNLYVTLKGKKYILITGWTTLLAILGCGVRELSCEKGPHQEWIAKMEIFRLSDGQALASASAMASLDETIIRKSDGKRVSRWAEGYQRRSMAITRATSKVCQMKFSWITTLANYAPTNAEEMPIPQLEKQVIEVAPAPDPLISQAMLREAVHVCATKKTVEALEGWFNNLSRYGKLCLKAPEVLDDWEQLKKSVADQPEEKAE